MHNDGIIPDEDLETLKKSIEDFVHEMDEKREETKSKAEEEAEPDDDGWVTISRKSKKKSTLGIVLSNNGLCFQFEFLN